MLTLELYEGDPEHVHLYIDTDKYYAGFWFDGKPLTVTHKYMRLGWCE